MLTPSSYSAISSVGPANVYRANAEREKRLQAASTSRSCENFDSVTLSSAPADRSPFHMQLVGRLSQEVRTATTTGDINALRQQVSEHRYIPDPAAIARRILFLGED